MKNYLGIEFGSTRIKAILIDQGYTPVSSGDYTWKSDFINGIWTYELDEAIQGLKTALSGINDTKNISAMGISGMMHGYLAFDENWNLLVPFRTWQNTITATAASELTSLFGFNIPQRWSIAHLYQAILNGEDHIGKIAHITTLSGYIHFLLTGENVLGIGEASGMFPIDPKTKSYDGKMLKKFQNLVTQKGLSWDIKDLLPRVLVAGQNAGCLTEKGAKLVDNLLPAGIPFAAPEGDGDTGMTATNSVSVGTGNVSAGTSIFSMVVLDKPLENNYEEIDVITTPTGEPVAMVHCNNCTNDSNAWINILRETAELFGANITTGELYTKLYEKSLEGDANCGKVMVCNYLAGEGVTHFDEGRPLVLRSANSKFTLANFMRSSLYSTLATLAIGMEILDKENVKIEFLNAHGGLFKTKGVGVKYLAAATGSEVKVMKTAGEGGPFGMALLAAYLDNNAKPLEQFLKDEVFGNSESQIYSPEAECVDGFKEYLEEYKKILEVERSAVERVK
ncbi:MAG: ATPase [Clostridia bacterium]|nr:ATPase [Clostridia bacterium]